MERMKFEIDNLVENNVEKIGKLFPNCITESKDENGKLKKAINFDMLKQILSEDVVEGDEAYEFTWVGKKESIVEAHKPIRKTLRPCKEESVNWDKTENLYIEGDNLDVLKLLQESYLNKVKMIYIDPPYNKGNDFIYRDKFSHSQEDENREMGMYDEDDNKLFKNTDTNGRFHSDWCKMIYPRLMLARNLLSDDGVIFISIDNNEIENLKKICNEVFGAQNLITVFAIENNPKGRKNNVFVAESYEYCLAYAKSKNFIKSKILEKGLKKYFNGIKLDSDKRQIFRDKYGEFRQSKRQVCGKNKSNALAINSNPERCFVIYYNKNSNKIELLDEYNRNKDSWELSKRGEFLLLNGYIRYISYNTQTGKPSVPLYTKETIYDLFYKNALYFKDDGTIYEKDRELQKQINSFVANKKYGLDLMTESATSKMENLLGTKGIFENSKSLDFIRALVNLIPYNDCIIVDFFSGSATTAHAVMQLNAEDGGNRKFIMVQLDEPCDEKSEAFKAGYKNICEIGKERIRRAGKKIIDENPDKADSLDIGFRTFKLDSTNMKDVYYSARDYTQNLLDSLESNIKPDRTDLDLLFGCLLEWGLPLSMPYKSEVVDGYTVHTYNDGDLIACFDENISDDVIKAIAERKPLHAVFRDSSFKNSPSKINSFEIFKMISPDTKLRVI